eukprot:1335210-Amphidinium_carterae.1
MHFCFLPACVSRWQVQRAAAFIIAQRVGDLEDAKRCRVVDCGTINTLATPVTKQAKCNARKEVSVDALTRVCSCKEAVCA